MKTETVICTQDPPLKCFRMPPKSKGLWFHRSSCSEFIAFLLLSTQIHLTESASPCFTEIVSVKRPGSFQCLSTTIKDNYCGPQACSWNSTVSLKKKDLLWHSAVWLTTTSGFDWMWWVVHMVPNSIFASIRHNKKGTLPHGHRRVLAHGGMLGLWTNQNPNNYKECSEENDRACSQQLVWIIQTNQGSTLQRAWWKIMYYL